MRFCKRYGGFFRNFTIAESRMFWYTADMEYECNRIVAIDVETPNGKVPAICQIGIVLAEAGEIVKTESYLVNPETYFDPVNISIHGITPSAVEHAPTFAALWPRIAGYFENSVVLAHNAAFDLGMLTGVLERYGIPVPPLTCCCTVQMARRRFARETYGSYRLDTLCAAFAIPLEKHHDALCDALACYRIHEALLLDFGPDPRDVRPYKRSQKTVKNPIGRFSTETPEALTLRKLRELLDGVEPMGFLNPSDSMAIAHWMDRHVDLCAEPPFDTIYLYLYRMISDKPLTAAEAQEFFALLNG